MPFIVFEGLDGSGKSTLIRALQKELHSKNQSFVVTREPGGTPLGEEIRNLLLKPGLTAPVSRAELLLYEAGRAQHVEHLIEPALQRGEWVLCDRFTASTLAFQCGGRGLDETQVQWLNQYATHGREPDLTVLLEVSVATAESRRSDRTEEDRFEMEKSEFHQRVHDHYHKQVSANPEKWFVLKGENQTPEQLVKTFFIELKRRNWLT